MIARAELFDRDPSPQEDHFVLRGERYVASAASVVLKGLDLEQLASFLDRPTTSQAIRDYRAALART